MKEIKDKLIEDYFIGRLITINNIDESFIVYYKKCGEDVILCILNGNLFFKISDIGNLVYAIQSNELKRNKIKDLLNNYLEEKVFNKINLMRKLENKLGNSKEEKRSKV